MVMLTLYPIDSSKAKTKKALKAYALGKDVDDVFYMESFFHNAPLRRARTSS